MKGNIRALQTLVSTLHAEGVAAVVVSSGSRSMPIVSAIASTGRFRMQYAIDERVAAFVALGIAERLDEPVALVCTSGSALLNYSPAIAEAYYRGVPLIVISADRPIEMIDCNDGQTIRQNGALANIIRGEEEITVDTSPVEALLKVKGLLTKAMTGYRGPVHLNVRLGEPLVEQVCSIDNVEVTPHGEENPPSRLTLEDEALIEKIAGDKIFVFIGINSCSDMLREPVKHLARCGSIVVAADVTSNVNLPGVITDIDAALCAIDRADKESLPDTLITIGGTPLSRRMKEWLRGVHPLKHVALHPESKREDTYGHLDEVVKSPAALFLSKLAQAASEKPSTLKYKELWDNADTSSTALKTERIDCMGWCDLKATRMVLQALGDYKWVEVSNGMTLRNVNASAFGMSGQADVHFNANRGVNGIDGSTSTAIGAALASAEPTILLTGDMSAVYDIGGLFSRLMPATFRMVIFDNGGGEIFRMIDATRNVAIGESYLSAMPRIDWRGVATAVAMDYHEAHDLESLERELPSFLNHRDRPAMLVVKTPPGNSEVYRSLYKSIANENQTIRR